MTPSTWASSWSRSASIRSGPPNITARPTPCSPTPYTTWRTGPVALAARAYWAGRDTRVDMGAAVRVAPWWHRVRRAHEIAMLDILLKGRRLHLGIGRGVAPHEYAALGYPMAESHKYFYDVVQI